MVTRTTHKVRLITGLHAYNVNGPVLLALQKNLDIIGPPTFTDEEQVWGKKLQKAALKEEKGFDTKIKTIPDDWEKIPPNGGSTDVAEVSFIVPTAGFTVTTAPIGVPWHSWATTASHGTTAGFKGANVAAKVLTLTTIDLLTDSNLRDEAKAYFAKKTGGESYKSPIPMEQAVILPK